uniref:taperin isoform X2 n=1 Tax=Doryrhamphus excisus TaxID=161450 RepID=UPI0025AEAD7E|nr:taperin isoform X2 [Doryrhamphus excisus]
MSGVGEVGLVRKDAGQENPRMPAWKREILERRKAKSGGSGVAAGATDDGGGGSPKRVNGEQTFNGSNSGGPSRDDTGRNYTVTTARNKEARPAAAEETTRSHDDGQESLVLRESLGPLEENPFIKLEKERRRRQDRENAARPIQHILELYGNVPGIRTIRAENIIIIESDPDYISEREEVKSPVWQQNCYCSMNDLLDRRCNAVTEIRAKEVVIYDTTLSKSEENLSTLGRTNHKDPSSYDAGEGQGMVSRILQKFDSNYGKLQKKSHSTENLLDLDGSVSRRPRTWAKPQLDLVPKSKAERADTVGRRQASSPVSQSSSKPKSHFPVFEPSSPQHLTEAPMSTTSFRQRLEDSGGHGAAVASRDEPDKVHKVDPDVLLNSKVPSSLQACDTHPESFSSKVLRTSPDFEIRASPKPDLSQIPDSDTQARALANLRLRSKNSFTVIPKRRLTASPDTAHSASATPALPAKTSPSHQVAEQSATGVPSSPVSSPAMMLQKLKEAKTEVVRPSKPPAPPPVATSPTPPPTSVSPAAPPTLSSSAAPSSPPVSPDPLPPSPTEAPIPADHLPVTNIDDIVDVDHPHRAPTYSPMVQRRKGNTFTVVPKRKAEGETQPGSPEPQQETSTDTSPGSTPPQAPYSQLGSLLKKRYPAVEEIEVIGGYLSLGKSCLAKTGTLGKKRWSEPQCSLIGSRVMYQCCADNECRRGRREAQASGSPDLHVTTPSS